MKLALNSKAPVGKKDEDAILRDLLLAIALCHNVTPIEEEGNRSY